MEGLRIVLNNSYIQAEILGGRNSIYKQKAGLAMVSPLSGMLAEMVMNTVASTLTNSIHKPFSGKICERLVPHSST